MKLFPIFLVSVLPIITFAGRVSEGWVRHSRLARNIQARNNTKARTFILQDYYTGNSFLNDWDYFTEDDPTGGSVVYLGRDDAIAKNLSYVQSDGVTVLAIDDYSDVPEGGKRNSVRIQSKKSYSGGLFIADFWAMPHGCSVWPAYWSIGPNWPDGGEIDIIEGVHNQPTNQYTLHSSAGSNCTISNAGTQLASSIIHDLCDSTSSDDRGCGFLDSNPASFGHGFNIIGGGIFAHLWDSTGVTAWHFPRDQIPADIAAKAPNPASWPTPAAVWSSGSCNFGKHFFDHVLVLDTTLCGDWAGPSYASSGCPGTCAQAVANNTNFYWAKWKINYVAVYQ